MFDLKLGEKKVEYLELIYDLIFVYLIGRNSSLVQHVENGFINWNLFLTYVLCTLIVIQVWMFTTFYINRYGSNGIKDHICIFINMYLLYFMADATRTNWHEYYYRYNIAWGLILLNLAFQYYLKMRKSKKETPWETLQIKSNLLILFIEACIVFASIPVYSFTGLPLAPVGMIFGIVATSLAGNINRLVPVDFSHLSERAMLYVVFTFGEMIIAIASYFAGRFSINTIYYSLLAFAIVVGLFLSYELFYDHLLDRDLETNGSGFMLIHVFLIFALSGITIGLEFMQEAEIDTWPKTIFITAAMLLYYLCLFMLGIYGKCNARPTKRLVVKMILTGVVFAALMLIFHHISYINIAVTVVFVFICFIYLWRFRKFTEDCV